MKIRRGMIYYTATLSAENKRLRELCKKLIDDAEWWFEFEGQAAPEDCDVHSQLILDARAALMEKVKEGAG
jgi:hypothetical protein